jgi:integrase
MENYKNRRKRIDEAFRNRTINELTVQRIDAFSRALTEATNRHDESASNRNSKEKTEIRRLSRDTAYRIQALLIQVIKWGNKKGYLVDNVTSRVTKLPKESYRQIEIPDIDSILAFMDFLNNDETVALPTKVFFNLIVWCGLRTEELLGLTWDNVNLQTRRIHVAQAVVRVGGSTRVVKEPKSRSSVRDVIVPERVAELLKQWKVYCTETFPKWLEVRPYLEKSRKYVLVHHKDGTLPHPGTFYQWLRRYLERHEFDQVTPHGLRHFFTTYLLIKGADVKTVSKLMGHSKTATTQNIYAALTKEGYDKVEVILNSTDNP